MEKYKILEHPADLKIKAFGQNFEEVFSNLLLGMFKSLRPKLAKEKAEREIKIEAQDRESLLVDFLSEALTFSDVNDEVYFKVKFEKFTDKMLKGKLTCFKVKSLGLEIKAVTWHNLKIEKDNNFLTATVLFDI